MGFPGNDACERCAAAWNEQRKVREVEYREWVDTFMGRPFRIGDTVRVRAEARPQLECRPFVLDRRGDDNDWSGVDSTGHRWVGWLSSELEKVE